MQLGLVNKRRVRFDDSNGELTLAEERAQERHIKKHAKLRQATMGEDALCVQAMAVQLLTAVLLLLYL